MRILSRIRRKNNHGADHGDRPFFVPDMVFLVTVYGLYIEQYPPNIYELAKMVEESNVNQYFRKYHGKYIYVGKQLNNTAQLTMEPFKLPNPDDIEVTSIGLHAMVITYPRTVARMIRRRLNRNRNNTVKGLKSIWVIILIVITLFIIFMVTISIYGAASDDNTIPTEPPPAVDSIEVQPSTSGADLTIPAPDIPSQATKGGDNIPRAVPIE